MEGRKFATPRGWEDLPGSSRSMSSLKDCGWDLILQYIQHPKIARDFASYYDLYQKYQADYQVEAILRVRKVLTGCWRKWPMLPLTSV
ncbi:MAG: hypothetical protein ACLR2E_16480 [Lachnospiraceae bacterium]